jgi:hypothetical protein
MKLLVLLFVCLAWVTAAQEDESRQRPNDDPMSPATFAGLQLRSIGPAFTSGRVATMAVNPNDTNHYYVAAASGGVWKTINNGITWTPVFDKEGSYSIGTVVLDPKNPSEPFVEFQMQLRAKSPLPNSFLLGYTNGYFAYFPTIAAAVRGGYGANSTVAITEVGAGERMLNTGLIAIYDMLGRLPAVPERAQ